MSVQASTVLIIFRFLSVLVGTARYTIPSGAGLDLSVLTSSLVPPRMVREDDTLWDFDSLLQVPPPTFRVQRQLDQERSLRKLTIPLVLHSLIRVWYAAVIGDCAKDRLGIELTLGS